MNLLIYTISIIIIICILYHLRENIKNLWRIREGFSETVSGYRQDGYRGQQNKTTSGRKCQKWTSQTPHGHSRTPSNYTNKGLGDHNYCRNPDHEPGGIWCYTNASNKRWEYCNPMTNAQIQDSKKKVELTGKDLSQSGRCANYKVRGKWVRDGVYSNGGSLEDCANRFGEEGGVFSYNPNSKGCLYTKTSEPHTESGHAYRHYKIKGITSGCKPEGWGGGWKFYKAEAQRKSLRLARPPVAQQSTYGTSCMPDSTIVLVGETPMKPKRGYVLENANYFKGKWDNFTISLTIKPLSEKSGWRNIIHNTMNGGNCCNNYERWPGIWFHSNTTKLHICWQRNQKFDPSYQLPLNKKSTLICTVNGAKVRAIIKDENDNIKYDQSITLSQHSPPNNSWRNGSVVPLLDYGGSMERMPHGQPKLGECEGDCDNDNDCQTGMKCYQRSKSTDQVPGCSMGGSGDNPTHDYCYHPNRQTFYMSDIWYEPADVEITALILDSNFTSPTPKILKQMPVPKTANAFYYSCEKKTFMEHHEAALAMGGHLASIHSAEENEAIRKILPYAGRVFIGAIRKRPHSVSRIANEASGKDPRYWAWTDGSKWDYTNWRGGEPNDCCKDKTGNIGEIYGEIQKGDGKWNDIFPKYNNKVEKGGAVYKLNATYPDSKNIKRLYTDGMNSWMKSKETCEGPQNSGTTQGSFGTLPSRREVLDYLKGKPLSGDKWIPTSEGNNVWLQVGKRGSRANHSPDYALLHTDIPDVAYTKSGEAGKPPWGITNAKHSFRNVLFCKTPPDGQTWDKEGSKWVRVANITQTGTGGATSITGGTSAITGKYAITTSISKGSKNIPLTNAQAKGFKIGQKIIIGTPPNTEVRTIVGFGG